MNFYKVPFDFTHEEKVFGGYISLRQMMYIVLSVLSIAIFFVHIPKSIRISMFLMLFTIFMIFAFVKIGNVYADKYFFNILKYLCRRRTFINSRVN